MTVADPAPDPVRGLVGFTAVLRHAGCGGELGRGAVCERCGTPVEADDVEWYRGPGTHRTPGERMIPA